MNLAEYAQYDGLGLAELVRKKEVSPKELSCLALEGMAKINPKINAVIETYDDLLDGIDGMTIPEGPFRGVPFLRKDLGATEAGRLQEKGSRIAKGIVAEHDSCLWTRFKKAGLVNLGRTTTSEFGIAANTEPIATGITRNPWNLGLMVSGSSGGAAASVAARIVPFAHGSDAGGSIRYPASCSGVVGLKPSRGRTSLAPDGQDRSFGFAVEFILSRSIRDTAAMLDAVHGPGIGDPFIIAPPQRPYLEEISRPLGQLRISFTAKPWSRFPPDPEIVKSVEAIAAKCAAMGHIVEEAAPKYKDESLRKALLHVLALAALKAAQDAAAATGREMNADYLEPMTLSMVQYAQQLSAVELAESMEEVRKIRLAVGHFFQNYDLLLTPTLGLLPQPHGKYSTKRAMEPWEWIKGSDAMFQFTSLFNATGLPAISLPLCQSKSGLPIGIQFAARFGDEATLLHIARRLEEELPWIGRKPVNYVGV
jgi:amidase